MEMYISHGTNHKRMATPFGKCRGKVFWQSMTATSTQPSHKLLTSCWLTSVLCSMEFPYMWLPHRSHTLKSSRGSATSREDQSENHSWCGQSRAIRTNKRTITVITWLMTKQKKNIYASRRPTDQWNACSFLTRQKESWYFLENE